MTWHEWHSYLTWFAICFSEQTDLKNQESISTPSRFEGFSTTATTAPSAEGEPISDQFAGSSSTNTLLKSRSKKTWVQRRSEGGGSMLSDPLANFASSQGLDSASNSALLAQPQQVKITDIVHFRFHLKLQPTVSLWQVNAQEYAQLQAIQARVRYWENQLVQRFGHILEEDPHALDEHPLWIRVMEMRLALHRLIQLFKARGMDPTRMWLAQSCGIS